MSLPNKFAQQSVVDAYHKEWFRAVESGVATSG
jgi:hypothetical protein